jgi:hypothetical protein
MEIALNSKAVCCFLAFAWATSSVAAQDTRTFPEAQCSYKLPGNDWEWLDSLNAQVAQKGMGQSIVFAGTKKGVVINIRFDPLKPDEKPTSRWYESFEVGFFKKTKAKKLSANQLTFKGVPSYQWDLVMPTGQASSVRALYANNKFYELNIVSASGPWPTGVDLESIFQGFNFTNQPQPVVMAEENAAAARGRQVAEAVTMIVTAGAVICLALYYDRWRKQRKNATPKNPSP